jgi:hypothetical protein
VHSPTNRLITSETSGKLLGGKATLGFGGESIATLTFEDDKADAPIDVHRNDQAFMTLLELGLWDRIDFIAIGGGIYGLKAQLYGESAMNAKAGNNSLALYMGYDSVTEADSADDGLENLEIKGNFTHEQSEIGQVAGHRLSDSTLMYLSYFMNQEKFYSGKLKSKKTSIAGEKIDLTNTARAITLGVERQFSHVVKLNLELAGYNTNWNQAKYQTSDIYTALGLTFFW